MGVPPPSQRGDCGNAAAYNILHSYLVSHVILGFSVMTYIEAPHFQIEESSHRIIVPSVLADPSTSTESKKLSKPSKSKANHIMNNDLMNERPNPEEHSPMEVDCKEVTSNLVNHVIKKEPMPVANGEHFPDALKVLQEFVREKLHRTVLSFSEFKKLLLLRQTGELRVVIFLFSD